MLVSPQNLSFFSSFDPEPTLWVILVLPGSNDHRSTDGHQIHLSSLHPTPHTHLPTGSGALEPSHGNSREPMVHISSQLYLAMSHWELEISHMETEMQFTPWHSTKATNQGFVKSQQITTYQHITVQPDAFAFCVA